MIFLKSKTKRLLCSLSWEDAQRHNFCSSLFRFDVVVVVVVVIVFFVVVVVVCCSIAAGVSVNGTNEGQDPLNRFPICFLMYKAVVVVVVVVVVVAVKN